MKERGSPRRSRRLAVVAPQAAADALPSWRLPSGLGLTEFALQGGFLLPALMEAPLGRPQEAELAGERSGVEVGSKA